MSDANVTNRHIQDALDRSLSPMQDDDDIFAGIPDISLKELEVTAQDSLAAAFWRDLGRSDPMACPDRLDHEDRTWRP